jgi:Crinkler effector protein N-terminal domain
MSTLALNCWVRHEYPPSDKVFIVNVSETDTVRTVRTAIKDQKPRTFQLVDINDVNLWQFSTPTPIDDNLGETFKLADKKQLRGGQTLSGLFSKPLNGDNLHIVVTVPDGTSRLSPYRLIRYLLLAQL